MKTKKESFLASCSSCIHYTTKEENPERYGCCMHDWRVKGNDYCSAYNGRGISPFFRIKQLEKELKQIKKEKIKMSLSQIKNKCQSLHGNKQEIAKLRKELKFKKYKAKTYNGDLDIYLDSGFGSANRAERDLYLNQYLKQGWDDTELNYFNNTLALFIYPRLQRYVELSKTKDFCYLEHLGLTKKQWDSILKKMLFTFKQYCDYYAPDLHSDPRYRRRLKEGMQLFAKYFPYLEL